VFVLLYVICVWICLHESLLRGTGDEVVWIFVFVLRFLVERVRLKRDGVVCWWCVDSCVC